MLRPTIRRAGFAVAALIVAASTTEAQAQGRPSEADIFGGGATPAPPVAPAEPPTPAAPPSAGLPPSGGDPAASTTPPAAAAEGTARDQSLLGNSGGTAQPLSDYIAPDNPLQIGGQVYLRAQSTAYQGSHPLSGAPQWSLTAPSLLDVYLDARPNPRVRAFVLGRMSFDPTRPLNSTNANAQTVGTNSSQGALTGTSATGFTSFSTTRGPTSLLDQMWIGFDIKEKVFVTAGKQHVRWGTGRFWQPTDYLHSLKRNPLDVFDARGGTSMLKLHVPWEEKGWNFYGVAVTEDPTDATASLTQVAAGGRAEIIVLGAELGVDALFKRGQKPRVGIDVSTGIFDFDVYADVGIRAGEDFSMVQFVGLDPNLTCLTNPMDPATANQITSTASQYAVTNQSGIKTQAVVGANWARKYNDNDVFTVGAEYFFNQPGYPDPSLYPGLLFNRTGQQQLNFFYTGRHYAALFASLPAPYSWNLTSFTLSTIGNLSDRSFVTRLDYSYTLLTHLSLEAFAGVHYGYRSGEFRFGADTAAQTVGVPSDPTIPGAPLTCVSVPAASYDPVLLDLGVALRLKI